MPHLLRLRIVLGAVVVAIATSLTAVPAGASRSERLPPNCEVVVIGMGAEGELLTTNPVCWRSGQPESSTVDAASSSTIAVHYSGASFTGSTFTVTGSGCTGGWLNLPSQWINVISSTSSSCAVTHFDYFYLTGDSETTFGGANLGPLNNRTNSTRYS